MRTRPYTQLLRLFYLAESLRGLRYGLGLADLQREVHDRMGRRWSKRSIARDLQILESLAFVERTDSQQWVWIAPGALLDQRPVSHPQPPAPAVDGQSGLAIFAAIDVATGEIHPQLGRLFEVDDEGETLFETAALLYGKPENWLPRGFMPFPRLVRLSGKAAHA